MPEIPENAVLISDGRSSVTLIRTGRLAYGIPTRIDVVGGPFQGSISDEVGDYATFHRDLVNLYKILQGSAKLGGLEGLFDLTVTALRLGMLEVKVRALASHVPRIELAFEFLIDQSYVPPIISAIDRVFLAS